MPLTDASAQLNNLPFYYILSENMLCCHYGKRSSVGKCVP